MFSFIYIKNNALFSKLRLTKEILSKNGRTLKISFDSRTLTEKIKLHDYNSVLVGMVKLFINRQSAVKNNGISDRTL